MRRTYIIIGSAVMGRKPLLGCGHRGDGADPEPYAPLILAAVAVEPQKDARYLYTRRVSFATEECTGGGPNRTSGSRRRIREHVR
jgi:hypothetical protein